MIINNKVNCLPYGVPAEADNPPCAASPVKRPPRPTSAVKPAKLTPSLPSLNVMNWNSIKLRYLGHSSVLIAFTS